MAKEIVKEEKVEKAKVEKAKAQAEVPASRAGIQTEKSKKAVLRATAAASKKGDLITKYQSHKDDTGSIEVQIAVLTKKVSDLTKHLQEHKKDFDSRRGLLMMVGKRRRLLNYLKKTDEEQYNKLIADLGLRR